MGNGSQFMVFRSNNALKFFVKCVSFLFMSCISFIEISCTSDNNYQGKLRYFDETNEEMILHSDTLYTNGIYTPFINVVDSAVLFYNISQGDFTFKASNLSTGQAIGDFCPIGHGHNEFISLSPIQQIYLEDEKSKTLLFAPNESKILIWNITESFKTGSTIYDYIGGYSWKDKSPVSYSKQVMINNDSILLYTPSIRTFPDDKITDPTYQIRTLGSNILIREIRVFNHAIDNKDSQILPESYLDASFSLKPDKTKFVEAMNWLPQINIVDLKSGKILGNRMKDKQDEDIFSPNMEKALFCYNRVVSDNDYIYALWVGTPRSEMRSGIGYNTIHIFDWEGRFIKKIRIEYPVNELTINIQNEELYGWNIEKQRLFKFDLNSLKNIIMTHK